MQALRKTAFRFWQPEGWTSPMILPAPDQGLRLVCEAQTDWEISAFSHVAFCLWWSLSGLDLAESAPHPRHLKWHISHGGENPSLSDAHVLPHIHLIFSDKKSDPVRKSTDREPILTAIDAPCCICSWWPGGSLLLCRRWSIACSNHKTALDFWMLVCSFVNPPFWYWCTSIICREFYIRCIYRIIELCRMWYFSWIFCIIL